MLQIYMCRVILLFKFILILSLFSNNSFAESKNGTGELKLSRGMVNYFQAKILTRWERGYEKFLRAVLKGWKPYAVAVGTITLLFGTVGAFKFSMDSKRTKTEFFPDNTPNQIIVYIEHPQGTDIAKTNKIIAFVSDEDQYRSH